MRFYLKCWKDENLWICSFMDRDVNRPQMNRWAKDSNLPTHQTQWITPFSNKQNCHIWTPVSLPLNVLALIHEHFTFIYSNEHWKSQQFITMKMKQNKSRRKWKVRKSLNAFFWISTSQNCEWLRTNWIKLISVHNTKVHQLY